MCAMEMQFQSPVKIVLRLQESPDEDLDVAAAFARQPDVVRNALLEAIRHVRLGSTDINLLRIEHVFQSTLKKPWKEPKTLRPLLEACRQGKVKSRTEQLFSAHGKEYGVVALCLATQHDNHTFFRDIDPLQDEDLVRLIRNVIQTPKKAAIVDFIEEFLQTPEGIVPDPPPQLARPRTRKKGDLQSLSPQVTDPATLEPRQSNKRKRLYHGQVPSSDSPRDSVQNHIRLPSPREAGLSALYHKPPPPSSISLPFSRTLPVQQSYPPFSRYMLPSYCSSQSNVSNPNTSQGAQPETARSSPSRYRTQQRDFRSSERPQQEEGQEERLAMTRRDHLWATHLFDSQLSQMLEQDEVWNILGTEFIPGRAPGFDILAPQMLDQEEAWNIMGTEFIPGRALGFDILAPQILDQEEAWNIMGTEFIPGRAPGFDILAPQMPGQEERWDM